MVFQDPFASLNPAHYYDVVAINAASMATTLAGLPFSGPIGGVRVALIDETWVCFPTVEQVTRSSFQMVVAGRVLPDGDVAIMMVEAGGTESTWENVRSGRTAPTEEVVGQGLEAAKPFIKTLCDAQSELKAKLPKETFDFPVFRDYEDDVYAAVEELATDRVSEAMRIPGKQDRDAATAADTTWCALRGIWAVRTHEVTTQRDAARVGQCLGIRAAG